MPAPTTHGFAEKVALITNGHEGIGRAVAIQLALSGCYVIISYPATYAKKDKVLSQLTSLGTLANAIEFSTGDSLIIEVEKLYGRLDLLINCLKYGDDSVSIIEAMIRDSKRLMENRPKPTIVNVVARNIDVDISPIIKQNQQFNETLLKPFRANLIVVTEAEIKRSFDLFETKSGVQDDDVARIVTFLLSSEAKALNGQVLYAD
jgi:NAD(P)-dependent dehydrogenase (short-subunit alcohol dehydrogenase family)